MTLVRMDNVLIVVEELGMQLEGQFPVEGPWVDRVVGLDDVRQDVAMLGTPDGPWPARACSAARPRRRLVGELEQYEDVYRLCYIRGPEGIILGLAEQLNCMLPEATQAS